MRTADIYPILLAAGPAPQLGTKKPHARFSAKNSIEIAVANCAGLAGPILVLGYRAAKLRRHAPAGVEIVVNHRWRDGLLGSLLAGLAQVPRSAPFMIYPVDHVSLTSLVIRKIVQAFENRKKGAKIFMPRFKGQAGHPVIFSGNLRRELEQAVTARDVVYRDPRRICYVTVRTPAIWKGSSGPDHSPRPQRRKERQKC